MSPLMQDLRFAFRLLAKTPVLTGVAVVTLALGIGVNTAIFSVVKAVLLEPLPFEDAHELVFITEKSEPDFPTMSVAYPNFLDWRERQQVFSHLAAHRDEVYNVTGLERPEQVEAYQVSASLFPMLGVAPLAGRVFTDEEDQPGGPRVLVLSWSFWQRQLGGDPAAVGRVLRLDGEPWEILGVMPPGFAYPLDAHHVQMWVPIGHYADDFENRGSHPGIRATARLDDGVSVERARGDLETVAAALAAEYPDTNTGNSITLRPLQRVLTRRLRPALVVLTAAVALVLLIACVNVANLLLARAAARMQEMAIRAALGAGRRRLTRQLLTESVLLALAGGVLGIALAAGSLRVLLAQLDAEALPVHADVHLDAGVLAFTFVVAVATGLLFGMAPALAVVRGRLAARLRDDVRTSIGVGGQRLRSALVVAEVALALVLLAGALIFLRSFERLTAADPGYDPRNVLTYYISLPPDEYPEETRADFFARMLEQIEALPGVESAAATLPLLGGWQSTIHIEGRPVAKPGEWISTEVLRVTPRYFETLGMRLLRGRPLTSDDRRDSPRVAVIDETFAANMWPGEDALGKRFTFGDPEDEPSEVEWIEVVGMVNHVKSFGVEEDSRIQCYLPMHQSPLPFSRVVVKTAVEPRSLTAAIENAVLALDGDQPIAEIATLAERRAQRVVPQRLAAGLLATFACLALVLAAVGIYGVMAYTVAQRRREIGIRMAFGAEAGDVLRLVLGRGLRLVLAGLALGLGLALVLLPLVADQLFETDPRDPVVLLAIAGLLVTIALFACTVPARRAARVDPMVALKYE